MDLYLNDLLARMRSTDITLPWPAHREAEQLDDALLFDELEALISAGTDRHERSAAYFAYGALLKHQMQPERLDRYMAYLAAETDSSLAGTILLRIAAMKLPADTPPDALLHRLSGENSHLRRNAILSLGSVACDACRNALRSILDAKDEGDTVCALSALSRIGASEDIIRLRPLTESPVRRIRESAILAIDDITKANP